MLGLIHDIINSLDPIEDSLLIGLLEIKKSTLKEQKTPKYALTYYDISMAKAGIRKTLNNTRKKIYPEDARIINRCENLIEKIQNQYYNREISGLDCLPRTHCKFKPHSKYIVYGSFSYPHERKTIQYSYCDICENRIGKMQDIVSEITKNMEEKLNTWIDSPELKELIETKTMINVLNRNLNNYKQNLKNYDASKH